MATSTRAANRGSSKKAADPEAGDPRTGISNAPTGKPKIQMNAIGPKRLLAYATAGLLSLLATQVEAGTLSQEVLDADPNYKAAKEAMQKTGYENLKPKAEREAELREQMQAAAGSGDAKEVMKLAKVLKAVQDGRPEPGQPKVADEDGES